MIAGLLSTELFQYLKCQDQNGFPKIVEALSYSAVHEISEGVPFFTFSLPEGRRAPLPPLPPVSYATDQQACKYEKRSHNDGHDDF